MTKPKLLTIVCAALIFGTPLLVSADYAPPTPSCLGAPYDRTAQPTCKAVPIKYTFTLPEQFSGDFSFLTEDEDPFGHIGFWSPKTDDFFNPQEIMPSENKTIVVISKALFNNELGGKAFDYFNNLDCSSTTTTTVLQNFVVSPDECKVYKTDLTETGSDEILMPIKDFTQSFGKQIFDGYIVGSDAKLEKFDYGDSSDPSFLYETAALTSPLARVEDTLSMLGFVGDKAVFYKSKEVDTVDDGSTRVLNYQPPQVSGLQQNIGTVTGSVPAAASTSSPVAASAATSSASAASTTSPAAEPQQGFFAWLWHWVTTWF